MPTAIALTTPLVFFKGVGWFGLNGLKSNAHSRFSCSGKRRISNYSRSTILKEMDDGYYSSHQNVISEVKKTFQDNIIRCRKYL